MVDLQSTGEEVSIYRYYASLDKVRLNLQFSTTARKTEKLVIYRVTYSQGYGTKHWKCISLASVWGGAKASEARLACFARRT